MKTFSVILGLIFVLGCNKKDDPDPNGGGDNGGSSYCTSCFYIQGNLDGTTITIENAVNLWVNGATGGWNGSFNKQGTTYSKAFSTTDDEYDIRLGVTTAITPDTNAIHTMFAAGSRTYSDVSANVDGVEIFITEPGGDTWSTADGSQAGSTFTITKMTEYNNSGVLIYFEGTFSCTLYHSSSSASKTFTSGTFRGMAGLL